MSELTKEIKEILEKVLDERLRNVATKDDLQQFITKEDAKAFATKNDLQKFATKDDLLEFPTKNEFYELKADVAEIKETVARIDKRDLEDTNALARSISTINKQIKYLARTKQDKPIEQII